MRLSSYSLNFLCRLRCLQNRQSLSILSEQKLFKAIHLFVVANAFIKKTGYGSTGNAAFITFKIALLFSRRYGWCFLHAFSQINQISCRCLKIFVFSFFAFKPWLCLSFYCCRFQSFEMDDICIYIRCHKIS